MNQKLIAILLLACTLLLAHCTRVAPESHFGNNNQKLASPYTMPAQAYLALAQNQQGSDKQALELMAAGRSIYDGQWRYGVSIITRAGQMSGELSDQKNILLAKVDLIHDQANAAITKLAAVHNLEHLSLFYQAQYHDMLANAYQLKGAVVESVVERIKLDYLLPDAASKANNRRVLWLALTQLSQPELDALLAETADNAVLQGWITLAEISRKSYDDPQHMMDDLQRWQSSYTNHPANGILPTISEKSALTLFSEPKRMALMVPLTGPLAGPGQAIQDGFMAAYQENMSSKRVKVQVYNTDKADVVQVYQRALADGADYVVGPLTKNDVSIVARMSHPVPTILLNDTDKLSDTLAFQFGLSPSQEARQIAVKARKSGYTRALVIAPAGVWGADVVNAFSSQWAANGGQVVDTWQYQSQDNFGEGIRLLLHASERAAKIRPTKPLHAVDNVSKRRQDFDVIILIAYPSQARQIMPLLRYYFAGDVPVYATSTVYGGTENTTRDRDLNGIIFCDMPWVFAHPIGGQHQWSEQLNSYNRLYALGMDSYALAYQLNHLMLFPAMGISEKSGVIYLTASQQLSRILVFGQFKDGIAHRLDAAQDKSMF